MTTLPRLLAALKRQPVDSTPVWMMRQAGRYLPEYRALRQRVGTFLGMAKNPEIACEITLQPLARFDLDAAILFSDILMIPDAMGLGLSITSGKGPQFAHPVQDARAIDALPIPDPFDGLHYVMEAITRIKREISVPLLGFCGSPWTVATYMVEGGSSRYFAHIKRMRYEAPLTLHTLLSKLTEASFLYLKAQIQSGVNAVMIFDTWGSILTAQDIYPFSLKYIQAIIQRLKSDPLTQQTPVILFSKHTSPWLEVLTQTGCDALSIDWTVDIGAARQRVGDKVALQGNLDPAVLYAHPQVIREEVKKVLTGYGPGPGHVFNLGHGLQPDMDPLHVKAMVEAVRELSPAFHQEAAWL